MRRGSIGLVIAAILVSACAGTSATGTPAAGFVVDVLPPEEPLDVRTAIAGQRCVFLVRVTGGDSTEPIEIDATADGATVEVAPATLEEGVVAEVTVVPWPVSSDASVPVTITVGRGDASRTERRTIPVWPETDSLEPEARDRLASFTGWLATEQPALGITPAKAWDGSALQTKMLVVSHYQFLSDDWEAALEWHVMIAPHDWSRIILRRRWVDDRPSLAFEIGSVSAGDPPREITPPEAILR